MKCKLLFALAGLLFLCGIGVLCYPAIKTAAYRRAEKGIVRQF